jgi:hypothetical protein
MITKMFLIISVRWSSFLQTHDICGSHLIKMLILQQLIKDKFYQVYMKLQIFTLWITYAIAQHVFVHHTSLWLFLMPILPASHHKTLKKGSTYMISQFNLCYVSAHLLKLRIHIYRLWKLPQNHFNDLHVYSKAFYFPRFLPTWLQEKKEGKWRRFCTFSQ